MKTPNLLLLLSVPNVPVLVDATIIYDLSSVTEDNPADITCEFTNAGCRLRYPEGSQINTTNPISFCDGYIMWLPRYLTTGFFSLESCNGTACTASCSDGCNCVFRNDPNTTCPTTLADADIEVATRAAPLLPPTCPPGEQAVLDSQYSPELCPNFLTTFPVPCECASNFCDGWPNGLTANICNILSSPPTPCGGELNSCVYSDRYCSLTPTMAPANSCRAQDIFSQPDCKAACQAAGFPGLNVFYSGGTGTSTCICDNVKICGRDAMPFVPPTMPPTKMPTSGALDSRVMVAAVLSFISSVWFFHV